MKNEGLDKLKNEAVNALVRWGKIGLGVIHEGLRC